MTPTNKEKSTASSFEVDSHSDSHLQSKVRTLRLVESSRKALTLLALLMGISVLAVSADALAVYDATRPSAEVQYLLPLWPDNFNLRPTVALVAGAAIVVLANAVSLICSRVAAVRNHTLAHTSQSFAAPLIGFVAAIVAMSLFYAVNASNTDDTLLSWTCRWRALSMAERPHFGTLCKESWAGVYLSVLLVPVEAAVLAAAGYQARLEKYTGEYVHARESATRSPSLRAGEETA